MTLLLTAVDVPRARDDLVESYRSGILEHLLERHDGPFRVPTGINTGAQYVASIIQWFNDSELFYVTPTMTAVARQAAESFPLYRLHADDLPAPIGFVVFADAVSAYDNDDNADVLSIHIRAALWAECDTPVGPGVFICTFADTDRYLDSDAYINLIAAEAQLSGATLAYYRRTMRAIIGPLSYHDEIVLPYGEEDARVRNTALGGVLSTWMLMNQPITQVENERMPRGLRRQYQRANRDEPQVRTIALHRTVRTQYGTGEKHTDDEHTKREYRHQWIVRGHWRNHWYPSLERHKQIYIPSYIKGPEDAPILGGERVYVLNK